MRTDLVGGGKGSKAPSTLSYRVEFIDWETELTVEFAPGILSPDQVVNLFNLAGFHTGVGSWRPENGGSHGQFGVVS